jgi:4-amino-4-deoxy-L-arabinose transferase-like glycosyltransferase
MIWSRGGLQWPKFMSGGPWAKTEAPLQAGGRGSGTREHHRGRATVYMLGATLLIVLLRLAMLGWPPLTDSTESRYTVIALNMHESGDWVTPRSYFYGRLVPYWGKPPLHFWLTAASFRLFGVAEATARLPGFLAGLLMLGITYAFGRRFWSAEVAAASALILASSLLFFGLAGTVTVDMTLACCLTAAMAAFAWFASAASGRARRSWGIAFSAAVALGMLAKGPIAVALTVLAVATWLTFAKRWRLVATFPWAQGTIVFLLVTCPWFLLAERATPGFLRYFFVNEHILRYLTPDYGDLYGRGHRWPFGTIWLLLMVGFLPWTAVVVRALWRGVTAGRREPDPWIAYTITWGLMPALVFTFARQIIVTYLVPGFAGLSVAAGVAVASRMSDSPAPPFLRLLRWQVLLSAVAVLAFVFSLAAFDAMPWLAAIAIGALALWAIARLAGLGIGQLLALQGMAVAALVVVAALANPTRIVDATSAKGIVAAVAARGELGGRPLTFPFGEPDSAEYYARLHFKRGIEHNVTRGVALLRAKFEADAPDVLVMTREQWTALEAGISARLERVAETSSWVACLARVSSVMTVAPASAAPAVAEHH